MAFVIEKLTEKDIEYFYSFILSDHLADTTNLQVRESDGQLTMIVK